MSILEEVVASLIWVEENFAEYITPIEEMCHNSKSTTFQEKRKTTGWGDAIASKECHFSPLTASLESRRVTLFH
jgi:hypothetical protein